ncbi:MAG: universal stress protein, partial [Phycisphaerales bacterium]|nr:universal stress protein [Phycisphaerales bacterium]
MPHPTSILAATDFSDASNAAIAQATRLANATGAPLHVLHTASSSAADELAAFYPVTEEYAYTEFLDAVRDRIAAQLDAAGAPETARVHVNTGNPFRAIVAAIEEFRTDLLVIGSTGVSGRRLGTIGGRCVRNTACNVLLVPEGFDRAFGHITACVDFSELSPAVLRNAAAFAASDDASLVALYAHERVDHSVFTRGPSRELIEALPGVIAARFDKELRQHTGGVPVSFT